MLLAQTVTPVPWSGSSWGVEEEERAEHQAVEHRHRPPCRLNRDAWSSDRANEAGLPSRCPSSLIGVTKGPREPGHSALSWTRSPAQDGISRRGGTNDAGDHGHTER